jgi:hypothetical protein
VNPTVDMGRCNRGDHPGTANTNMFPNQPRTCNRNPTIRTRTRTLSYQGTRGSHRSFRNEVVRTHRCYLRWSDYTFRRRCPLHSCRQIW